MEMEETGVMEESTMMQNNEETSRNALRYETNLKWSQNLLGVS